MSSSRWGFALETTLRLVLAGVYLYAAWEKIVDPLAFARALHNYRLFPDFTLVPLALALPIWEALAGLGLLTGIFYRGSVLSIGLMSVAFALAVASAAVRGIDLSCGCFGAGVESKADWRHVAGNAAAALAALWLLRRARRMGARPIGVPQSRARATSPRTERA